MAIASKPFDIIISKMAIAVMSFDVASIPSCISWRLPSCSSTSLRHQPKWYVETHQVNSGDARGRCGCELRTRRPAFNASKYDVTDHVWYRETTRSWTVSFDAMSTKHTLLDVMPLFASHIAAGWRMQLSPASVSSIGAGVSCKLLAPEHFNGDQAPYSTSGLGSSVAAYGLAPYIDSGPFKRTTGAGFPTEELLPLRRLLSLACGATSFARLACSSFENAGWTKAALDVLHEVGQVATC